MPVHFHPTKFPQVPSDICRRLPGRIVLLVVMLTLLLAYAPAVPAESSVPLRFEIPAGNLDEALVAFEAQADLRVIYNPALVRGKTTVGLSGNHHPGRALESLLVGSGLTASFDGRSVTLARVPVEGEGAHVLSGITVTASADASAAGLSPAFSGGQVARGGRAGILGTRDHLDTPFAITSYTNELIQDRQARSVGEVLQNDPGVRVARGFGNFQESYFMRGFLLGSDDVSYNGLYSLLPRQYIATELFERVEVLRGASAFLNGVNPGGGGIGGAINLLPKRAPNDPLTRLIVSGGNGPQGNVAADIARRFGPDGDFGVRFNAAYRDGGTAIDDEESALGLMAVGLDWRSDKARLSADLGWQDNRLDRTRTNITLASGVKGIPDRLNASSNFAQPWSYSDERDLFGTLRGEYDLAPLVTAWAAYGLRCSEERNSLANLTVTDASTGDGYVTRFDNAREDSVHTGEAGLRGSLQTGSIGHDWTLAANVFQQKTRNAYAWDYFNRMPTNLYSPTYWIKPEFSVSAFKGNDLDDPKLSARTRLTSIAFGDILSAFDEKLQLTLGMRLQKLELANYAYNTGFVTSDYNEKAVTPMVALVYKVTPELSLYANYIEALTQGDTAPSTAVNFGEMLDPYVSRQKETGVKFEHDRIGLGLAAFSTTRPRSMLTSGGKFVADGKDRHRGLELTVYGELVPGLRLLGGATWLEAKQISTGTKSTEDAFVIGVPRFQANTGLEWEVPWLDGLALDARAVHTGSSYYDAANTLKVPGWTRFDAGARYVVGFDEQQLTFRVRAENLTGIDYWSSVGGHPGSGYLTAGAPRSFLLSVSMDF